MPAPRALPLRTCFIPSSFLLLLGWERDEPFSTLTAFHLPWVFKRQPFLSIGFFPSFFRSFYSIFLSPVSWVLKAFPVIDFIISLFFLLYTQFILSFLKLHPLYSTLFSPYLHLFHSIFLSPASWVLKPFSSLTLFFLFFTLHPLYSHFLLFYTYLIFFHLLCTHVILPFFYITLAEFFLSPSPPVLFHPSPPLFLGVGATAFFLPGAAATRPLLLECDEAVFHGVD